MNKFCKNCGAPLNPKAKFCGSCGTVVSAPHRQGTAQNSAQAPAVEKAKRSDDRNTGRLKKLLIPGIAFLTIVIALAIAIPRLFDSSQSSAGIESVTGQPYAGRAIAINGEGFGYYNPENCRVTIDGKDTPIISWGENEVSVIVPAGITAGKKEVLLSNPPAFDKKSIETEFMEHKKTELASVTLSPSEDNRIERDGFTLIVPAGSVAEEKKIIIYKYDAPATDDSPYYVVTDEYEITGPNGDHVFFDHPVLFGLDVKDEEEALQTSFQIFDEFAGLWAKAETVYVEEEGKMYLATNHFSGFRRFVSVIYQGSKKMVGEAVDAGKKGVDYIYQGGKAAKDTVVKLGEEAWVAIKDATVEDFVGVSDADNNFIIYYRVADAKNDPSIPDMAREMAAAFSTAYNEYRDLFGEENVPTTKRTAYISADMTTLEVIMPDPIKVYIDPRYTGAIAKSATTGNIIMPAEYREGDLASTCAHELFHVVQYHQLGLKQLYMGTTGLKDLVDNRYTGNSTEVYRFFANNMWFLEATAEYAGRFIGTNEGIGAPIHRSIDASKPYYAYNGYHDYGVSSFLDYILATRQPDAIERGAAFKEMWNTVTGNYSMTSSINVSFDGYVWDKLNESADAAYLNFWREAFTRSYMPEVDKIAGGLTDVMTLNALKISSSMPVNEKGAGIFRYNLHPKFMREDKTALTCSFWLEASPASMQGFIYRLDGLEMSNRVMWEPLEGTVNYSGGKLRDALIPYHAGDAFGLVAVFYNSVLGDADANVTISSTAVNWDNQKDIEKKVGNTTLRSSDKLVFTPTLPGEKPGDPPFNAVVTLNNNEDYKTELDRVENGKSFTVGAPMKDLPPGKILVNIKIFRDGTLVHEYQAGDLKVTVSIKGPQAQEIELAKDALPLTLHFTAEALPAGEYNFKWVFDNGATQDETAKNESSVTADYHEFKKYEPSVTLYDIKGNKLATAKVSLTIKEKETKPAPHGKGMDGKWVAYGIYLGYGPPDPLGFNVTLSINGGQFSMSRSGANIDSWTGGGYVEEYTDALGEQAFKLVPDTGNKIDDSYFAEYFGLERGGLFLDYSDERDEVYLGTTGAMLYFERE